VSGVDTFLVPSAVPRLLGTLFAGQTVMCDCGSIGEMIYDFRDASTEGPRLYPAWQIVEPTGGADPMERRTIVEANG